jgi:hypothetical protein
MSSGHSLESGLDAVRVMRSTLVVDFKIASASPRAAVSAERH